jgi:hypothetical protein
VPLLKLANLTIPSARLDVELFLRSLLPGKKILAEQAWLDTGAPLSVIPFHVHHRRLDWTAIPGVKVTWAGQVCDLGIIETWLATEQSPSARGPFKLLAKFPQSDPPGTPVPILLGLEFLISLQATLSLPPPPQQGVIQVP